MTMRTMTWSCLAREATARGELAPSRPPPEVDPSIESLILCVVCLKARSNCFIIGKENGLTLTSFVISTSRYCHE